MEPFLEKFCGSCKSSKGYLQAIDLYTGEETPLEKYIYIYKCVLKVKTIN